MSVVVSYPGVYVEEIASGVRTITGVATGVAAFVGRTRRGPVNQPLLITSFGDFERLFGGLWAEGPLTYAVRDFYQNGGKLAVIVRLYHAPTESDGIARMVLPISGGGNLELCGASPGAWANDDLTAAVNRDGVDDGTAARYGLRREDLFNLTLADRAAGRTEVFRCVSVVEGPRRVDRVLLRESKLARVTGALPSSPPSDTPSPAVASGGSDGAPLVALDYTGKEGETKSGIFALQGADLFNMLCIPPDIRGGDIPRQVYQTAMAYCAERRAILIVDPPAAWGADVSRLLSSARERLAADVGLSGPLARNAVLYFPRIVASDSLREGQTDTFPPCGAVAGVIARTDAERGVWKAPAGLDTALQGTQGLEVRLTDAENGILNPLGINCLRSFPEAGMVVWGARTLRGAEHLADEYKYLPVRRLALFIEESLYRGTQWVVFEENDEPLWSQIRLNVGSFMRTLFRQGAFQGASQREAYFVKCDRETTTQDDIDRGVVNIVVGFAPLKPAEFVVIQIQQMSGQIRA